MNDDDVLRGDLTKLTALQVRLSAGPRCALCGREYDGRTEEDLRYVGGGTAADGQSVHATCWEGFAGLCERLGLDWRAAVEREFAARRKGPQEQDRSALELRAYIDANAEIWLHERRGVLVDKKFGAGLTSDEEMELANIDRRLDELEAPFYDDLMAKLPELVEEFWGLSEVDDEA